MRQLAFLLISLIDNAFARCPLGSVQGVGRDDCFKLSRYADSWYGAEEDCRSKGGHLTSVGSAFTNAFLRDQSATWNVGSATSFWLGASEGSSYGSWTWSDGTRFSYTNWARGEPSNDTALCLAASTQNGLWSSEPCYQSNPYICKLPAAQEGNCPSCATSIPPKTTWSPSRTSCNNVTCPPAPTCACYPGTAPTWATPPATSRCDFGFTYSPVTKDCWTMKLGGYSSWQDEVNYCASYNSTAISIHSPDANRAAAVFAHDFVNSTYNGYISTVWIGLYSPNARWQWVDNSTYNYANWSQNGEANCGIIGGDCDVAMSIVNGTSFGKWTGYSGGRGPDNPTGNSGSEPIICVRPAYY